MAEEKIKATTGVKANKDAGMKAGAGLDVGTAFLVSSRENSGGEVVSKKFRNAFINIDKEHKRFLSLSNIPYVEREDDYLVLGDESFSLASLLKTAPRRPMQKGLLAPSESDAYAIMVMIIKKLLGDPIEPNEKVCFSVPGVPVDIDRDVIYHKAVCEKMIKALGYEPVAMNEAAAIVFSEGAKNGFTGIGISFGGGLVNVSVCFKAIPVISFSISNSGDFIDEGVARATNISVAKSCIVKEQMKDLLNPAGGTEEAIAVYYNTMVEHTLVELKKAMTTKQSSMDLSEGMSIYYAGGTSMVPGFDTLFAEKCKEILSKFFKINDIVGVQDRLYAVSRGLLVASRA